MITTKLHTYHFYIDEPGQKEAYENLKLKLLHNKRMHAWPYDAKMYTSGDIELETKCIFDNQWNSSETSPTNPNARVFDWRSDASPGLNKSLRRGHYLEITQDMFKIRDETYKCGYCGAYYHLPEQTFCNKCLDSEYLETDNLPLLRLQRVSSEKRRPKLTQSELDYLMPIFVKQQTTGKDSRNAKALRKQRENLVSDYKKTIKNATAERDGFLWLMDNKVNINNCIYYKHTGIFTFGWRKSVAEEVKSALLDILSEFPFEYEIK